MNELEEYFDYEEPSMPENVIELKPQQNIEIRIFNPSANVSDENIERIAQMYFRGLSDRELVDFISTYAQIEIPYPNPITRKLCLQFWDKIGSTDPNDKPEEKARKIANAKRNIVLLHPNSIINELLKAYSKAIYLMTENNKIISALFLSEKEKDFSVTAGMAFVPNVEFKTGYGKQWLTFQKWLFKKLSDENYKYLFAYASSPQGRKWAEFMGRHTHGFKKQTISLDRTYYDGVLYPEVLHRFKLGAK